MFVQMTIIDKIIWTKLAIVALTGMNSDASSFQMTNAHLVTSKQIANAGAREKKQGNEGKQENEGFSFTTVQKLHAVQRCW